MRGNVFISALLSFIVPMIIAGSGLCEDDKDWEYEFIRANVDIGKQYEIIDRAIAAEKIPIRFLSDVINTDKFADLFPTYCVFRVLQIRTAMWLSKIATKDVCEILSKFYYGGGRSRILNRPTTYSFDHDRQKPICEITDSDGTQWALTNIWWYGCASDLWLVRKNAGNDIWQGPWFTGIRMNDPGSGHAQGTGLVNGSGFSLSIIDNDIHIVSSDGAVAKLISPEVLTIDSDEDGLYDIEEQRFGTDWRDDDTDGDGLIDGVDINPLAPGKRELQPWDYARMAVLMQETIRGYPMVIYYVQLAKEDSLEFRIPSPNGLVLPVKAVQLSSENSDCLQQGLQGQQISMGLSEQDEFTIEISLSTGSHTTGYCVEKLHGVWILTEENETIQY